MCVFQVFRRMNSPAYRDNDLAESRGFVSIEPDFLQANGVGKYLSLELLDVVVTCTVSGLLAKQRHAMSVRCAVIKSSGKGQAKTEQVQPYGLINQS